MNNEVVGRHHEALHRAFWESLSKGVLVYQHCRCCRHAWLPPREECPSCWSADGWEHAESAGTGVLKSWVVYHKAYHPDFADSLPYNVAIVELDEGPRMVTNIVDSDPESFRIEAPVELEIRSREDRSLATFRIV